MLTLKRRFKLIKKRLVSRVAYAINPQWIYGDDAFYDDTREHKIQSYNAVADLILETFNPKQVVDIGCGEGMFLNVFHQRGIQVLGCDISEAALRVSPKDFVIFQADATKPIRFNKKFDLCICVEIAEHIPTRHSKTLVENLTQASDTVFFTAAPPWQGGVGHINEQPFEFWHQLFEEAGFKLEQPLSDNLKARMKEHNVVFWLQQNLMVFTRQ